ncbi:NAD(P)-binding protein [Plenodomus tracheiphilus IPT5]|uniref:NAD(P)-binding protein n=1 Tax=Plenodomus tracheiphilus IPT5 TaxID=1408161 RepID=A0A6A7AZY4_9PLEO|nr:NAD(P)-binding protein [Plenodomus tracheiphilus IPT5]
MASKSNYIQNVTLIGGSGSIGSHILTHLLTNPNQKITVLTRSTSTATFPPSPNLLIKKVDYTNEQDLISALQGTHFLIITLSARAPPTLHPTIVRAAGKAKIPYIMPNHYGFGLGARAGGLANEPTLAAFKTYIADVEREEEMSYVVLVCSFWYEFSLGMGEEWFGFDIPGRRVVFYDEGVQRVCTTTWERCGRAVAGLLGLPVEREGQRGEVGYVLSDFKNKGVYVKSFLVSQREMLDSLHRVLGTADADWQIEYQGSGERHAQGLEEWGRGEAKGFAKAMYARVFFESGEGDYATGGEMHDGVLGLPSEDLDEATRRAVGMVEGGFGVKKQLE